MLKLLHYAGEDENGPRSHIITPGEPGLVKTAAPLHHEVQQFIAHLKPRDGKTYALVNALGATELYGPNINADGFSIDSLKHEPPGWCNIPPWDVEGRRRLASTAPYGHTTFYLANAFRHHRNKNYAPHNHPSYGTVELSVWNDYMKRVELVIGLDHELCRKAGGWDIVEKLESGEYLPVSMGCFLAGSLVTMADGTRKPIEQVKVGDEVITHRGRARKVTETHARPYKGAIHSIKAEAHPVVHCTEEHPFYGAELEDVKDRDHPNSGKWRWRQRSSFKADWMHASCLETSNFLLEPVTEERTAEPIGEFRPDPIAFARLLGYYLAEGHPVRDKKKEIVGIELTVNEDDEVNVEIEGLCERFQTENAPVWRQRTNSERAWAIGIYDKRLAALCVEHAGMYSTEKRLSRAVMGWNRVKQLELLGAYANGDGCGPADGSLKFSTSSKQLAWQVYAVLLRVGVLPSVGTLNHKATGFSKKPTTEYVVHVGKQHVRVVQDYTTKVQPTEVLAAKNARVFNWDEDRNLFAVTPIREINAIYAETTVYNLEVEEDESYCVEGLAVHNCRVKYDTCSLCGQKSKTRNDYCGHMNKQDPRFRPNLILPDGRQIFVWNPFPRFFDISFVLIGADKTAKVMGLLASGKQSFISVPAQSLSDRSADRAADLGYTEGSLDKAASPEEELLALLREDEMEKAAHQKVAVEQKLADIIKELPPDRAAGKAMPLLERIEPDIPRGILSSLSQPRGSVSDDIGSIAATAGKLGIVLKPREFQHLVLSRCGNGALADELGGKNQVFSPCLGATPFSMGSPLPELHKLLHPFLATRSMMGAPLKRRITIIISVTPPPPRDEPRCSMPLLDEISRSYNGYRHSLLRYLAGGGCDSLSRLHQEARDPLAELFARKSVATTDDSLAGLFSLGPLMYLLRAYWDATKLLGPEVSQRIAAENPGLVAKLAYANPV